MKSKTEIELLSPAKDLICGKAAINLGADAVYVGPPKFGARKMSANSLSDIRELVEYAHQYNAKVYCTLNTILFENELEEARKFAFDFYEMGVDALIIQDFAFFEMDLPPIPIFASTQTNNYELERIQFLEKIGVQRVILARELSLSQITNIKNNTSLELEAFVSGSLCVCLSGQCYLSAYTSKRSANRGECSQPCRLKYSLVDSMNKTIVKDKYLLSLKDLDLSANICEMIDAGISSFKIEGRLKDINYVKNVTGYYRKIIDSILEENQYYKKSSSGKVFFDFSPDVSRTFNRGFSSYFINNSSKSLTTLNTPKSIGKKIGLVSQIGKNFWKIKSAHILQNGDGICFFSKEGELFGEKVLLLENDKIRSSYIANMYIGQEIFRNNDIDFERKLNKDGTKRKVYVEFHFDELEEGFSLTVNDEDDNCCTIILPKEENEVKEITQAQIEEQLSKIGNTIFFVSKTKININSSNRLCLKTINKYRRSLINLLISERKSNYKQKSNYLSKEVIEYPKNKLDFHYNISNSLAEKFYKKSKVEIIELAVEETEDFKGKALMTSKYCIKNELNICPFDENREKNLVITEPLYLISNQKKFKISFDCKSCMMKIFAT